MDNALYVLVVVDSEMARQVGLAARHAQEMFRLAHAWRVIDVPNNDADLEGLGYVYHPQEEGADWGSIDYIMNPPPPEIPDSVKGEQVCLAYPLEGVELNAPLTEHSSWVRVERALGQLGKRAFVEVYDPPASREGFRLKWVDSDDMTTREVVALSARVHRLYAGFSIEELAKRAGLDLLTLAKLEEGAFIPDILLLERLAGGMGIHPTNLFG